MANLSTNEFKSGLKFMLDGDPCSIIENELVKPGKGQAFNRVKFRNLKTGRVNERTFKSGDSVESADVMEVELEYSYTDGEFWYGTPLVVTAPNFVNLVVADTDPGLKGDTSGGGGKPATLETGAVVRVPLFIEIGELLRVDTRSGEYVERAKT